MLVTYTTEAATWNEALGNVLRRAAGDRWAHVDSVESSHRTGPTSWVFTISSVGNDGPQSSE